MSLGQLHIVDFYETTLIAPIERQRLQVQLVRRPLLRSILMMLIITKLHIWRLSDSFWTEAQAYWYPLLEAMEMIIAMAIGQWHVCNGAPSAMFCRFDREEKVANEEMKNRKTFETFTTRNLRPSNTGQMQWTDEKHLRQLNNSFFFVSASLPSKLGVNNPIRVYWLNFSWVSKATPTRASPESTEPRFVWCCVWVQLC